MILSTEITRHGKMSKTNLEYLEEVFKDQVFNLAQPIRGADEMDDLIDLNPTEEDHFEDEVEEEEKVERSGKRKRKQKKKNRNDKFKCALVGDSNFKKSEQFLEGVIYRKATCLNNKEASGGLADALNFVVQLNNVKTVVVSSLQNAVNDEGILEWKRTVTKYVLMISTAATKRPDVNFIVLGPFLRTQKSNHGPLLVPMLDQLQKEFGPVKNVRVDSSFRVSTGDLQSDGVHLRPRTETRLFALLKRLFREDFPTPQADERRQDNPDRPIATIRSQYPDLRSFLDSRTAPLFPPQKQFSIEYQSARSGERRHSLGVHRSPSDKSTVEQPHSPGVGSSQSDRQALERRHSLGVRHSRFANRDRSHSPPIVNKIENLDNCFMEMFGRYPRQEMYFAHRERAQNNRSLSPRSSPDMRVDLLPRRRPIKERLGWR